MKIAKVLICMLFSLVILTLGVGYAQLTDEITATADVNFRHYYLFFSRISPEPGVTVTGYSDIFIVLNVTEAGKGIDLSISNPMADPQYYLEYVATNTNFTLSDSLTLGTEAAANGGSVDFTLVFNQVGEYSIQFVFTVAPPEIGGGDDDEPSEGDEITTNATAVINLVINDEDIGLNSTATSKAFPFWCNDPKDVKNAKTVLFCRDSSVSGGNLNNKFKELGSTDVYYTLEWVDEDEYHLYLYYSADAEANRGKYITVYRQGIVYNSEVGKWVGGHSEKGYAKVVTFSNKYNQIETGRADNGNACVIWYDTLDDVPDDAEFA